jgi:predicted transcriptional regulator
VSHREMEEAWTLLKGGEPRKAIEKLEALVTRLKTAMERLREYLVKGFVLDDERLKAGKGPGPDDFDELVERIRDIRASEKRFYEKLRDLWALAVDYDPKSEQTREPGSPSPTSRPRSPASSPPRSRRSLKLPGRRGRHERRESLPASRRAILNRMSTTITETDLEQQAGTFRMTPEEKEEIDQADAEGEEDAEAGRLIPLADVLAKLKRPLCDR